MISTTLGFLFPPCLSSHMKHIKKLYNRCYIFSMFIILTTQPLKAGQLELQKMHTLACRIQFFLSVSTFCSLVSDGFRLLEMLLLVL